MKSIFLSFFCLFTTGLFAQNEQRVHYENLLELRAPFTSAEDVDINMFSDLGAWHAYYFLPEKDRKIGFGGPVVMQMRGSRISESISVLKLKENGKELQILPDKTEKKYYPGMLEQSFETEQLQITQQLIFVNERQTMIKTVISNMSDKESQIGVSYEGQFPASGNLNYLSNKILKYDFPNSDAVFEILFDREVSLTIKNHHYKAFLEELKLSPGSEISFVQSQIYSPEALKSYQPVQTSLEEFNSQLLQNKKRWDDYLNKLFENIHPRNEAENRLAVKSMITLITNWRSPAGDLKHNGVFPSVSYQGFYGFWSWDSWKIAVGVAIFDPELAEDIIRSMFDFTDEKGMVADCVYFDSSENNWRDTKPPLSAWGVWEVFQKSGNKEFIEEMYPHIQKYHEWWYEERDLDGNGLCEYGSTDGTEIAAKWESGMDNAVRFDEANLNKINERAWTFDLESVDLNAYLYAEKQYLALMAELLGDEDKAESRRKEATELKARINESFYNPETGFYYDLRITDHKFIEAEGPEGWIPLWTEIADRKQAEGVKKMMMNPEKFNTFVPLPTLTADHPKFNPLKGYWRGPVWIDQFYFGAAGLNKYGFTEEARQLTQKFFQNGEGVLEDSPLYENYHPTDGKGLNARNFSWTAAHILMLLALGE